ncbi:unnamed protein product [Phytophthora fragariaefolia]|uniref:Unnamed protein product n=1 Tax=Phytophthora fragariaefolia TaxID=1490495 RepID=A0A9W6Y7J7_9STRA|nr:unnamed protein product [Phytophthora fragariaefolia]
MTRLVSGVAESAVAAQRDATELGDDPNAGAAHQPRLGATILETESPDQASEREHLSRVDSARHETAELKEALQTASTSFTKSIFALPAVDSLSHEVSQHEIRTNPAKLAAITELPFPTSKKGMQSFLGVLNDYSRFIQNMAVYGAVLYQLKDANFDDWGDLAAAKLAFAELKTKLANAPILRHFDSARDLHLMLFANACALSSTLLQPHKGLLRPVRFCGRILKENGVNYHPAEKVATGDKEQSAAAGNLGTVVNGYGPSWGTIEKTPHYDTTGRPVLTGKAGSGEWWRAIPPGYQLVPTGTHEVQRQDSQAETVGG